jgi:hypothetical protein
MATIMVTGDIGGIGIATMTGTPTVGITAKRG